MCKAIEDMIGEAVRTARYENAKKMLIGGELAIEKIVEYSGLSVSEVKTLAGMQTA